jgi:hypothetical protein|uniref:Uncharacterized protein n=1 Tax=Populus trichocarpa TaxID=3694 RepID=A0A3N7FXV0_POPTR
MNVEPPLALINPNGDVGLSYVMGSKNSASRLSIECFMKKNVNSLFYHVMIYLGISLIYYYYWLH